MRIAHTFGVTISLLLSSLDSAHAERMPVSQLSEQDRQYLYRGWPFDVAECGRGIIEDVIDFGVQDLWFITFSENETKLVFDHAEGGHEKVCEIDGMREIGSGQGGGEVYDHFTPHAYD
jgi:hypothetical protein